MADCRKCDDTCCYFLKSGCDATPVLTEEELALIKKKYKGSFSIDKQRESDNVFRIRLQKIRKRNIYVCPFLEKSSQRCKINDIKPFDCRFWPFLLMKNKNKKDIYLAYFDKTICPGLKKVSRGDLEKYKKYIVELFRRKKYLDFVKNFPEIACNYDEDAKLIAKLKI